MTSGLGGSSGVRSQSPITSFIASPSFRGAGAAGLFDGKCR